MGAMGLHLREFEALTPAQFDAVYSQWRARQDSLSRERWEMARIGAYYSFIGHCKKRIKATDLMRFEWDIKTESNTERAAPKSTQERFDEIRKRWK